MVAAQQQAFAREADLVGDREDEFAEVPRRHAGVAAELVDLVGRGFDQHGGFGAQAFAERRAQYDRMRGADRVDADRLACLVAADEFENGFH